METISIPVSYNTNVSLTPGQLIGITGTFILLLVSSIILIKSFSLDKK